MSQTSVRALLQMLPLVNYKVHKVNSAYYGCFLGGSIVIILQSGQLYVLVFKEDQYFQVYNDN